MAEGICVGNVPVENATATRPSVGFAHEALFYEGERSFLRGTVSFVQSGLAAGEGVLVMVGADKADVLRRALGPQSLSVQFADSEQIGDNPARAIPLWQEFLDAHGSPDRPVRGVCEAVRPRHSAAVPDCQRHEQLLNAAFGQPPSHFRLLCPYDMRRLCDATINVARRTHPHVWSDGQRTASGDYATHTEPLHGAPLLQPPRLVNYHHFDVRTLHDIRETVADVAQRSGVTEEGSAAIVLAVNELTSNSIRYGGGGGSLSMWCEDEAFLCEVRDRGVITDPLVGCIRPTPYQERGRGLWMVNQLCDMVQLHSSPEGTVVRIMVGRRPDALCVCH